MASDSLSLWLNFLLSRRYSVSMQGDPMPGADGNGPYIILANNPALIDPLLVYARFAHLSPRPVIDHDGLRALRIFSSRSRPLKKEPDDDDEKILTGLITDAVINKESVLIWPAGRLQTEGIDVLSGKHVIYGALSGLRARGLPLPEIIMVRVEGMWGSRFSSYGQSNGDQSLTGTLLSLAPWLCFGPLLPRRQVNLVLRRHTLTEADMSSQEKINDLLSGWFNARQHSATIVPLIPGMPTRNMPLVPQKGLRKKPDPIPKPAPPSRIPPAKPKPDVPDLIDQGIAEKQAAAQAAQAARQQREKPEFLLKKIKLSAPPRLPVHLAATRNGDVWDGASGHIFSRRNLLGLSKALGRKLNKGSQTIAIALPTGATAMAAFLACLDNEAVPLFLPTTMPLEVWKFWEAKLSVSQAVASSENLLTMPHSIALVLWEDVDKSDLRRGYMSSFAGLVGTEDINTTAAIIPARGKGCPTAEIISHARLLDGLEALILELTANQLKEISLLTCLPPCSPLGLLAGLTLPLACGLPIACGPLQGMEQAAVSCGSNVFIGTAESLRTILETVEESLPLSCAILEHTSITDDLPELLQLKCPEAFIIAAEGMDKFYRI